MYRIDVSLTEAEFMEIASMVIAADTAEVQDNALLTAFKKIKEKILPLCNSEQLAFLNKCHAAIVKTFETPSIQRGMVQGGMQGLMEQLYDELDK